MIDEEELQEFGIYGGNWEIGPGELDPDLTIGDWFDGMEELYEIRIEKEEEGCIPEDSLKEWPNEQSAADPEANGCVGRMASDSTADKRDVGRDSKGATPSIDRRAGDNRMFQGDIPRTAGSRLETDLAPKETDVKINQPVKDEERSKSIVMDPPARTRDGYIEPLLIYPRDSVGLNDGAGELCGMRGTGDGNHSTVHI